MTLDTVEDAGFLNIASGTSMARLWVMQWRAHQEMPGGGDPYKDLISS